MWKNELFENFTSFKKACYHETDSLMQKTSPALKKRPKNALK
jgi:hypothetical protein